jgi:hypothetical protein
MTQKLSRGKTGTGIPNPSHLEGILGTSLHAGVAYMASDRPEVPNNVISITGLEIAATINRIKNTSTETWRYITDAFLHNGESTVMNPKVSRLAIRRNSGGWVESRDFEETTK